MLSDQPTDQPFEFSPHADPRGVDRRLTSYGDAAFSAFLRRAFLASAGLDREDLERPVVGIVNTTSDYTPCHRDMPALIDAVKRGVLESGALPFVFPVMSLGEVLTNPTTMLFRNLMAMELEEQLRSQPMDSVVLLGGCDKTMPAELMAAASADIPAITLVVGPMMTGNWRGERLGACTDCRRMWGDYRGGILDDAEISDVNQALCPTAGTCMVMGTASTMACILEALGMTLPFAATAPAVSAERLRLGTATGRLAADLTRRPRTPRQILTRAAFHNAMIVLAAIGGSTNAVIHLTAIARRLGISLTLDDFHAASAVTPILLDCKPAGSGYLPELHRDGGMPALLAELAPLLELDALTISGQTLGALIKGEILPTDRPGTIRPLHDPVKAAGSLVTLSGSLAPGGAVIKAGAATPALLTHTGPAAVFDSLDDLAQRLDDPALGLTPAHILVLRNIGPAAAGMPEAGAIPIPKYLAQQGVRDMVRISDGRMSGTAFGTVVLHVTPESARGGPLAFVRDGDLITLDVQNRVLDLLIDSDEIASRRSQPCAPPATNLAETRGWRKLSVEHVLSATDGADLDFMTGTVEPA